MTTDMIIEIAPFQVANGVTEDTLFKASKILEHDFLRRQKGFIKRELLKRAENLWIDVVYWASKSDAEAAAQKASETPTAYEFFQLLELNDNYGPEVAILQCRM